MGASPTERFRRVDTIFDAVVDLPTDGQVAYIDRACGDDQALRAEVYELVRAYHRSDVLESAASNIAAPIIEAAANLAGPLPDQIGSFRVVREIGRGGMGRVYLGERADGDFEQKVALKLIQHGAPGIVRRFVEERRILALLDHPGIARLVDGGITSGGLPYFAMELVDGEPIDKYCDSHALSIEQRLDLFVTVCEAVSYAHQHLIIHRDLKPSNILVRADGQVKLLDFGIAKLIGPQGAELTRTELSVMTPEFAAPEQIRGTSISTATDVYSLGVLLYMLLAGNRPYDIRGKSPGEIERIVCTEIPPRPSQRAPAGIARKLRGDLDLIVMTALQKDESRRYQSPAALAQDVQRYRQERAILARPDSAGYRIGKFITRNRTSVALSAVAVLGLIGATAFSVVQMREARAQREEAVRAAQRATAISELQSVLAGDTRDPDGNPLPAAGRIAMAEGVVKQRFASDPALVAELMADLSNRHLESGDLGAQRAMLARARQVALGAPGSSALALVSRLRSSNYWLEDILDSARASVEEGKRALAAAKRHDVDVEAICLEAEGKLLQATGKPDSGVALLKQAVALGENEGANTQHLGLMNSLAEVLRLSGRTREAVPYFEKILQDLDTLGYAETEAFPNVVNFLAASMVDLGEFAAGDSVVRRFIEEREAKYGKGRVPTLFAFLLARSQLRLGALDSADIWLARAMRDTTQGAGQFQAFLPSVLADLRLSQSRIADARPVVATLPADRRGQRATAAMLRARLQRADGDSRGASEMLEREMGVLMTDGQQRLTLFALPLITAGEWRLAGGDAAGADSIARLARTAAAIDSLALTRSALAGRAELLSAQALRAKGDRAGARDAARRAATALANGYGAENAWTRTARQLADSLGK